MWTAAEWLVAFIVLYPVVTAAWWMAGGVLFAILDEDTAGAEPEGGWPGISVLIPAYNEGPVIARCVGAALAADYPEFEVLVFDDGSTDDTASAADVAIGGDRRGRVVRDPVNRGKADRLNLGFEAARYDLVVVTDADTHVHPQAFRWLVARMSRSPLLAAVAGGPHVTNRGRFLPTLQVLETASIIGLFRRTQALTGRVGVVAGVLGLFRRDRVLAVGGYDPRMATEDIDLTWRLLLAGWETTFEPHALVGMQVPSTLRALWAQRSRWARGQGEVLHERLGQVIRLENHRMWMLALEAVPSLLWVAALALSFVFLLITSPGDLGDFLGSLGFAWGFAVAVLATVQMVLGLTLDRAYDPVALRALLLGPLYPIAYWLINAAAALRHETVALVRGPRDRRVVWDIPREDAGLEGS